MIDLTVQGLTWCWRHGHPIIGLVPCGSQDVFWITLSPEDAQALSPLYQGHASGRARIYALLETLVERLDGQIVAVRLGFGRWDALTASMEINGPACGQTIPVHVVDAIVLAARRQLPIQISEQDFRCIQQSRPTSDRAGGAGAEVSSIDDATPESFRHFIESLDLGQLDDPGLD